MSRSIPFAFACSLFHFGSYGQAGMLDPSFGTGGIVETVVSTAGSQSNAVAVQPDGRILLAGNRSVTGGSDGAIVRYLSDGTVDLSFALNGYAFTTNGGSLIWVDMALRPDGRIVVAGVADAANDHLLARFNEDGTPDLSFGTSGTATLIYAPSAMLLDPDGNILVVSNTATEHVISRYLENGSPDLSFGTGGSVVNGLGADQATGFGLTLQGTNILVTGGVSLAGEENVAVTRYTATGAVDTGFGTGGTVATECGSTLESGKAIAMQADGKIVVGAEYPTGFVVLRYLADGTPDPTFDVDGQVFTQVGVNECYTKDIIVQPDGALLVGGRAFSGTGWSFGAARYLSDGSLDPTFGAGGMAQTFQFGVSYYPEDMALQPDGRLLLAGARQFPSTRFCMIRYFTDLTTAMADAVAAPQDAPLWPNPVIDHLWIHDLSSPSRYAVVDGQGRTVLSGRITGEHGLSIAHLAPGSYVLHLEPANGASVRCLKFTKE